MVLRFRPAALHAAVLLALCAPAAHAAAVTPDVIRASRHDVSAPMRDIIRTMPPALPMGSGDEPFLVPNILLKPESRTSSLVPDYSRAQTRGTGIPAPAVDLSFDGINQATSGCGCLPPDTNGDVSDEHYIQWVNGGWAVYDKTTGATVQAPTPGNSFFVGFGGKCETTNSGDPIALWDPHAQRWVMSQFVTTAPFAQCVAVSTTSDPLGTYARYEFNWPVFGDYPKMGVWTDEGGTQDAYTLITHEFGASFQGAALIAMDRAAMLAGEPDAAMVRFAGFDAYGVQPIHLGPGELAPNGTCPTYIHFDANTADYLFWDMCLDWDTPANTTISAQPERVAVAPFVPFFDDVQQQGSANGLDSFGSNLMYRATARTFPADAPTRTSLVVNHVVQGPLQQAGIGWAHFNLRPTSISAGNDRIFGDGFDGAPLPEIPAEPAPSAKSLVDEGTYAPDASNRWMGGIAIDASANIGVGYSQSSALMHPQLQITGRALSDEPGMLRDEQNCTAGVANGSQTSTSGRWGDYSSMSLDPVDQCTFYFTSEYYATTSAASWRTRVCSFKFEGCGDPDFAIVADSPKRLEMCAVGASDPQWELRAGVLNGFTGPVSLTAIGAPGGSTPNFSANPVQAPGTSTLTLAGGATLASGEYAFSVEGTSGANTRSVALELGISSAAPAAPVLTTPADDATGVKVVPTLSWNAVPGALSYAIEVASDAGFTTIVASGTSNVPTWAVTAVLDSETEYFWRVTPDNYCGDGPVSTTSSFTTGVPGECPTGTTATVLFEDDMQSGVNGWTTDGTGAAGWTQQTPPAATGLLTTAWGIPNNATTSDRGLVSPTVQLPVGVAATILSFDTYHKFEIDGPSGCWDNGTIEAKLGAGVFNYLDNSRLFTDPYDGLASPGMLNAGALSWCHTPASGPIHSIVDLDGFEGQDLQLRWRAVSDSNTTAPAPNGMYVDNVKIEVCQ
ncbi:MAG: hypothetical protein EOP90_06965 [Lysobacteraceae bacterium]|nr:MAG: hypothetical protein EOP90_06965 [Xanthomonadaceae bacterium]